MIRDVCMGTSRLSTHELHIEEKCANCGKTFLRTNEHVYTRSDHGKKYYCSYTCFRVWQRKDEEQKRLEYELECEKIRDKEEWNERYLRVKKLCRGEEVKIHSKADAEAKLEEAEIYIRKHMEHMFRFAPGTHERLRARRNMTRWKRKAAYIRCFLAALQYEEDE